MLYNLKNQALKEPKSSLAAPRRSSKAVLASRAKTPVKLPAKSGLKGNFMSLNSRRMIDSMTFNLVICAVGRVIQRKEAARITETSKAE